MKPQAARRHDQSVFDLPFRPAPKPVLAPNSERVLEAPPETPIATSQLT
jgi:hypothetical protein